MPLQLAVANVASMDATKQKRLHSLNIRLDDATMDELRTIAAKEGRTLSNLAWFALREWLEMRRAAQQE